MVLYVLMGIIDDLPDLDTVIIPYGGGGLSSGIASAIRALKPDTKIYACEVETAAPLPLWMVLVAGACYQICGRWSVNYWMAP